MGKRCVVLILAVLLMGSTGMAKEIGGVNLPDSLMAGQDKLILNGAGLRKKFIIKVYAGGLYLMQKDNDPKKIVDADAPMAIRMQFIYDGVSGKDLVDTWNEGFANATGGNISPIKAEIDKFNGYFIEEAKKNDIYDIIYIPGTGVNLFIKGKLMGIIKGYAFKNALFSIWLGDIPADKNLKKGMLGK